MNSLHGPSRRNFIKKASLLGATAIVLPAHTDLLPIPEHEKGGEHYSFLFQGDSITDGNRSRNMDWNHVLGHGYAYLIAADLLYRFPVKSFQFFNRGVSGNQITDLTQRWPEDTIALKPNLISILIGVNDTMNAVNGNKNATISNYEGSYRALLTETKRQLPGVELVICEPFILPVGKAKDDWDLYHQEISARQEASRKIAMEFQTIYIPLQKLFMQAAEKYPPADYWLWDGIHPMPNGHELIARQWIKQVGKKIKFIS
jgi:lysophospholipase L1-like esterase